MTEQHIDRNTPAGEIKTSGKVGSYPWHAYWFAPDHAGIEFDLDVFTGYGCGHTSLDLEPADLEAMVAGLAMARIEWETTHA